ncbi:MAG: LytR C-terminal domain-containing protein [bacterium]|nr:LytR C-terminal domain-containing protein [bacterium]
MRPRAVTWLILAVALGAAALVAGVRGTGGGDGTTAFPAATEPVGAPHLLVLNGAGRSGLAREISLLLGPAGCVAAGVDNAPGPARAASVLVNRRLPDVHADRLARRLGNLPVLREWDGRTAEDAVLVLGADWERVRTALAAAGDDPAN